MANKVNRQEPDAECHNVRDTKQVDRLKRIFPTRPKQFLICESISQVASQENVDAFPDKRWIPVK